MRSGARTVLVLVLDALGLSTIGFLLSRSEKPLRLSNLCRLGLAELLSPAAAGKIGKPSTQAAAFRV